MNTALSRFALLLLIWLTLAAGFIAAGGAAPSRTLIIPLLAFGSTLVCTAFVLRMRTVDAHLRALGVRLMVAFHGLRFIGALFIWAHHHGHLPATFAYRAGVGDLVAAAGAMLLLQLRSGPGFRRTLWVWNVVGTLDLFIALGTAIWLNLSQPGSMNTGATLPWAFIPLVIVPLLLATHAKIFQWLCSSLPLPGENET